MTRRRRRLRLERADVLFLVGLVGIVYETVVEHVDRPFLLGVFGGMIGLPAFYRLDKKADDE